MRLFIQSILILIIAGLLFSCRKPSGTLHIIHAGSLTVPVREAADSFKKRNPGIRILTEAWGSKAGARRISDLELPCDVFISADYKVIDRFLIPGHASWNIKFAGNEMSVVYNSRSRHAGEINAGNWHEILLRDDVIYGRSDPDSDPCGARTVMLARLAGIYYYDSTLPESLLSRHHNMIRPKEVDLLALLESHALDYIFLYRSVAQQHGLGYVVLPDELNLKNPEMNTWYGQARVEVRGPEPGETVVEGGEAIIYGITVPNRTKNPELAEAFVNFFLSAGGGMEIMERNWQHSLVPLPSSTYEYIPDRLKSFALDGK